MYEAPMSREATLTIAFSFLAPTIVFFVVAASAGAPRLITSFLMGLIILGVAVGAIFAAARMWERRGPGHP
jgi:hypothetical protein